MATSFHSCPDSEVGVPSGPACRLQPAHAGARPPCACASILAESVTPAPCGPGLRAGSSASFIQGDRQCRVQSGSQVPCSRSPAIRSQDGGSSCSPWLRGTVHRLNGPGLPAEAAELGANKDLEAGRTAALLSGMGRSDLQPPCLRPVVSGSCRACVRSQDRRSVTYSGGASFWGTGRRGSATSGSRAQRRGPRGQGPKEEWYSVLWARGSRGGHSWRMSGTCRRVRPSALSAGRMCPGHLLDD